MSNPQFWDELAPRWDRSTAGVERRFMAPGRRWIAERVRGRLLDVGIGTGMNLDHYVAAATPLEVSGVDFSSGMLEQARLRAQRLGMTVDLRVAEAGALPFEDDTFDTVVCTYVLCSVPSVDEALAEMVRVLRPDGQVLLADHVASTSAPVRWGQRLVEALTGPRQGEYWTRRPLDHLPGAGLVPTASRRHLLGIMEHTQAVPG